MRDMVICDLCGAEIFEDSRCSCRARKRRGSINVPAGDGQTPSTGSAMRMARRDVINAVCRAQQRANIDGRPELAAAYYEAVSVLLEHWQPDASQNAAICREGAQQP